MLSLFSAFWSQKSLHVLFAHHHDHEEHLVCEAAHDPNTAHIHDERWAVEDCTLCAFVVHAAEPFVLAALPVFSFQLPESELLPCYLGPACSKQARDSAMRRGPPQADPCIS
jgi:hypothetical protein